MNFLYGGLCDSRLFPGSSTYIYCSSGSSCTPVAVRKYQSTGLATGWVFLVKGYDKKYPYSQYIFCILRIDQLSVTSWSSPSSILVVVEVRDPHRLLDVNPSTVSRNLEIMEPRMDCLSRARKHFHCCEDTCLSVDRHPQTHLDHTGPRLCRRGGTVSNTYHAID